VGVAVIVASKWRRFGGAQGEERSAGEKLVESRTALEVKQTVGTEDKDEAR
jgi:hypothetical protein